LHDHQTSVATEIPAVLQFLPWHAQHTPIVRSLASYSMTRLTRVFFLATLESVLRWFGYIHGKNSMLVVVCCECGTEQRCNKTAQFTEYMQGIAVRTI